jgi:di/tricarboxylate transporter
VDARRDLLEVIVPNNSDLIGRPLKQTNFRARYDAVIIGVQREGQPLHGKIGDIALQTGDLLLLSAGANFTSRNERETSLITINQHKRTSSVIKARERYFRSGSSHDSKCRTSSQMVFTALYWTDAAVRYSLWHYLRREAQARIQS